ncbi:putative Pleckstrin domain-containing family B member 2-like protein [Naja naja]|nr:putative Pleckstrin domain-containing family B member 2-like protein [Naja naja]
MLCADPFDERGLGVERRCRGSVSILGNKRLVMALVKSGWLLRQSTILRRWKKNWFDLWSDGHLLFYDNQHRHDLEDKVHMKIDCINIRGGNECRGFQPPEGKAKDCLLQIISRDGKVLNLCAESTDDCLTALSSEVPMDERYLKGNLKLAYVASEVMYDDNAISSAPPPYTAYATPSPEVHQIKCVNDV